MSREHHQDIRIGTLAPMQGCVHYLKQILPHGFESFELTLGGSVPDGFNFEEVAKEVAEALTKRDQPAQSQVSAPEAVGVPANS